MSEARGERRRVGPGRRIGLLLLALMLAASLTFGVARAGDTNVRLGAATTGPLLGITGNVARFQSQTGQASSVHHAFLGWGQGLSYGSTFAALFPTLGPIPMIHLGTEGRTRARGDHAGWHRGRAGRRLSDRPQPGDRRLGQGDLRAADGRDEQLGQRLVRLSRERTRRRTRLTRRPTYRKAFARIYVILHGGSASAVNAKLQPARAAAGPGRRPPQSTRSRGSAIVWSPLAGDIPRVAGNAAELYYPGAGLRRRRRRRHLRRAPHRHRAVAGPREAVHASHARTASRSRCPEWGLLQRRRPGVRPAHVHVPEDARPPPRWRSSTRAVPARARPRVEAEEPRRLPGVHHAARRTAPRPGRAPSRRRSP